ncbi:MAG: HAMP domain-containing sensor histidine kinase, partial [Sciscionella sp.]
AALRDGSVHSQSVAGSLVVAVPVADTVHVAGVVRASTSQSEVYPRIALTWLAMLLLGAVAVGLTWLAARRYARRLARPLERLARSATTLGEGDFSVRTEPSGIGEIDAASGALNQTAERIGELVDRERAFTADASHQLRTPLTGLRLGLESGLEASPALYRAVIETAIGQADRLEGTIDDLLALARDVRQHEVVHIAPIVRQMREHWHGTLAARGRRFTLAIDEGLPVTRVSTAALRQVLAVLVDNAIVHGEGTVDVHARDAGGALAIDVRDEGSSITVEETTLFRRRVSSADQGHGIGLALARSLAEAEGGRLQLAGRNPSTFSLLLPATESD